MRRDRDDVGLVDLRELVGLGGRRAGHARELLVHAEVVLEGDRGEGLVLLADLSALLGLEGLVQALRVAAPLEHAARELVHDQQLAVADDVLLVLAVERVGLERLDQVVDQVAVDVEVEVLDAERLLDLVHAALGGRRGAVLLVDVVVLAVLQRGHDAREAVVGVGRGLRDAGDDQRRPRLVDEDRVDLVHDAEVVAALDAVGQAHGHVVAQVVEAELGVGAVGGVGGVRLAPLGLGHHRADHADADPEEVVERAHPVGVAAGQVVVDRDHVHAAPGERVEVDRGHAGEGLALAGLHLGDLAAVEDHRADQLHVEEAHAEHPPARLADDREGLGARIVRPWRRRRGARGTRRSWPAARRRSASPSRARARRSWHTCDCMAFIARPSPTRRTLLMRSVLMQRLAPSWARLVHGSAGVIGDLPRGPEPRATPPGAIRP